MPLIITKIKTSIGKRYGWLRNRRATFKRIYEIFFWPMRFMPGSSASWGPPRGLYKTITEYNKCNVSQPFKELIIQEAKADFYNLPWSNSAIATSFFKSGINTEVIEKKFWFLFNVRYVYGHAGAIITADDKIFLPLSRPEFYRTYKNHQLFYRFKFPKMVVFKKVILMDTLRADENNYCHWMRDHLTRLFWLKQLNINFSEYTLIATNGSARFCKDTRDVMIDAGFNFKEWFFTDQIPHFFAEEIIVPPYVNFDFKYGIFDNKEIQFLRDIWLKLPGLNGPVSDRIYLSRRKAVRRYTADQAELTERLADYGVKEVFLEDLTVFEQATVLNNASLIIGLHGAALVNLIFCQPGVSVIEIFGADQIMSHFWSISNKLNLNYFAYCDDDFKGSNPYRWRHLAPTFINVDNFFACFTQLHVL